MAKRSKAAAKGEYSTAIADALATIPPSPPDAETQKRLSQVFLWIIQGQTEQDIREAIAETWPGQAAGPMIAYAIDQIEKSADYDPTAVRGWCFEAYRELYRQCLAAGDFGGAIRAVSMIREMTGA